MRSALEDQGLSVPIPPERLVLRLRPVIKLSPDELLALSSLNGDLRLEMSAEGELIIMAPAGGEYGRRNMKLAVRVGAWAERDGTGIAFDSSTGFVLPNGAIRSPDAAWVERSRYEAFAPEQREKFLPLCPDLVVELRSPSDTLTTVQEKMREYMDNGARLGLLLDPTRKRVFVYKPRESAREHVDPEVVPEDPMLPGFALKPRDLW